MIELVQNTPDVTQNFWGFDGENIEDAIRMVSESNCRCLSLELPHDSKHKDLDFLLAFPEISSLSVRSHWPVMIDASAIGKIETLEGLGFSVAGATGLNIDRLQNLTSLSLGYVKEIFFPKSPMPRINILDIEHFDGVNLEVLKNFPSLQNFDIRESRKLVSTRGIETCRDMKELKILYCSNLVDIESISALYQLNELEFHSLKKLSLIDPIFEVYSLRKIIIEKISPVKQIKSIGNLRNLEFLVMSKSEIIDGDLGIVLDMPKLHHCYIRPNKIHYRPTASYVYEVVGSRDPEFTKRKHQMALSDKLWARRNKY
ncbi:leucine-rich repeat domain-containing protein [Verminephrobacter aporrectodeae]|uniref:hypothetical protein n=1 Tax=Verminephrobacter aporrectodeae TaxID=1110389 RepID=UPI00223900B2|nr:hypothetical protein [Verminephrobacter aporrectodeae]